MHLLGGRVMFICARERGEQTQLMKGDPAQHLLYSNMIYV